MAFYCELPNERICDIGWERLTCTEQWLEDQIREIQGYSREQRVRLGKECVNDVIRFLANMYKNDEAGTDSYLSLYLFAVGIACLNRTSATQAWKDEVVEVFHVLPEALENVIRPFDNGNPFTYQTVVATMAIFGTDAVRPIGSRYLQLCICIACADTPNVAAFDWIRKIHREYLLLLDRWNHALYAAALGGDRSEMTVEDDYQNEKPILPLREYRRQQRAAERKKRQAKESEAERRKQAYAERHERMQREAEEKEQRIQNAQAEYEAAMAQWRNQTEKAERDRKRALEQRLKQEEKNLRDEATQRRNAAVRENNRIIAEQEKLRKNAEQTISGLGALKLVEKARQKKMIREFEEAIASAKAAQKAAEEACTKELSEVEEKVANAKIHIQAEIEQTYPLPEKPKMSPEVECSLRAGEQEKLYKFLTRQFGFGKNLTLQSILETVPQDYIDFSVFDPKDEPLTIRKLASVMKPLVDSGRVIKLTEKRRIYYVIA